MYVKKAGEPARDLSELCGDPWASGIISDAPDHDAVARDLEQYDRWVDEQAALAGVTPGGEAYETVTQAIKAKDMIGGDPALMQHGHQLPMQRRDFMEYSGQTVRDVIGQQDAWADQMLEEYRAIYGDEAANDTEGLGYAVEHTMKELKWQGHNPARWAREHPGDFLHSVRLAHELGHGRPSRYATDDGRTGGIGGSGSYAPEPSSVDRSHPYDDPNSVGMVAELRDLQRKRGW